MQGGGNLRARVLRCRKGIKKTKKTAMEKELKIKIPKGYEIDRQKSTFEKIIFKKIPDNPKTWEDYCSLMKGKTIHYPDYYYII